jgi:hypothetical protein
MQNGPSASADGPFAFPAAACAARFIPTASASCAAMPFTNSPPPLDKPETGLILLIADPCNGPVVTSML